jgi:putative PIN family toxin of toxin-antitoxin system
LVLRAVVDTNVLVAARRSRIGASNVLFRMADEGAFQMLASVPLFLEYEAVLTRSEHLAATGSDIESVRGFLGYLAGIVEPVRLHYLWRPQLIDVADEMFLETAINGRADCVVTFNSGHFGPASKFGIQIFSPSQFTKRLS